MAYIKKLASGNFQAQIRLKGLQPICKTFSSKALATQFVRQVEGDTELQRKLGLPACKSLAFSELVDQYLAQTSFRDKSARGRILFWKTTFADKAVHQIDEFMVDQVLHQIAARRTGSTVNRYKSHLSAMFTYLIRHPDYKRLGLNNPVRAESVGRYRENKAKQRFLWLNGHDVQDASLIQSIWEKIHHDRDHAIPFDWERSRFEHAVMLHGKPKAVSDYAYRCSYICKVSTKSACSGGDDFGCSHVPLPRIRANDINSGEQ